MHFVKISLIKIQWQASLSLSEKIFSTFQSGLYLPMAQACRLWGEKHQDPSGSHHTGCLGLARGTGACVTKLLTLYFSRQDHFTSVLDSLRIGSMTSTGHGRSFARYLTNPFNLWRPSTSLGASIAKPACAFSGSMTVPLLVRIWPINGTSLRLNSSFSPLRAIPLYYIFVTMLPSSYQGLH